MMIPGLFLLIIIECQNEYYGKDCKNKCSVNCKMTRSCDKITGQCDGGCITGWSGHSCSQSKRAF